MAALVALGVWGWQRVGWQGWALAISLPLFAAVVWATLRVPNDPGVAPVTVPGWLRLTIELALFAAASLALYDMGAKGPAVTLGLIVVAHYVTSYDRIVWLMRQ